MFNILFVNQILIQVNRNSKPPDHGESKYDLLAREIMFPPTLSHILQNIHIRQ